MKNMESSIRHAISLRPWRDSDIPSLLKYANNPNIANNLMDRFPHPFLAANAQWFLNWANTFSPPQILAIDLNGEAIGSIGLHPLEDVFRLNCELGYWVAEPFWGKGIATQAIGLMVAYAKANFAFTRLFARPYGSNIGSQKALLKAGFVLEARFEKTLIKNGKLEDELVFGLRM
jgi:RimJ/RimL family protein N-acetyltransferase